MLRDSSWASPQESRRPWRSRFYRTMEWSAFSTACMAASRTVYTPGKEEAIAAALEHFGLNGEKKREALMIGDRKFDAEGAQKCGIDCVGVYYGYAEPGELERAGAVAAVNTVKELEQYLLRLN